MIIGSEKQINQRRWLEAQKLAIQKSEKTAKPETHFN